MMSENMISSPLLSTTTATARPLPMAEIESSVSTLLLTTKKLLETLTAWSCQQVNDKAVYEEYNALERHFASATEAFESALLPMDDMMHLPDDLFNCLKDALSKEPSSTTIEEYLPLIRDIILKLLQGLKKKQFMLRERFEQQQSNNNIPLPLPSPSSSTETTTRFSSRLPTITNKAVPESTPLSTPTTSTFDNNSLSTISLFLKFNDRIKRVKLDSLAIVDMDTVKRLFIDKFSLEGDNTIETILILDNESNVEYELEDLSDIQPYTILSINAPKREELNDEIKTLFKETMHQVLQSIKEKELLKKEQEPIQPQQQEMKKELNRLKQDLSDLNQIYTNFKLETESIIKDLRSKQVPSPAAEKEIVVINNNKTRDEMNKNKEQTQKVSAIIINRLENLQDKIDQIKLDVTQKRCRPSKIQLNYCQQESNQLQVELNHLSTKLKTIKPVWKKTWETQLQQIVKEQQFFKEQELLLVDLKEDYQNVNEVLTQLNKIFEIHERKKKLNGGSTYLKKEEDGDGMSSVIKQVATIEVNHSKRLEALNQAEQKRSKELSSRIDEFERELTNFVGLNKLKSIGGPEAIEQKRQEKDISLIKQFFVQQKGGASHDDVILKNDLPVPNLVIEENLEESTKSLLEQGSIPLLQQSVGDDSIVVEEEDGVIDNGSNDDPIGSNDNITNNDSKEERVNNNGNEENDENSFMYAATSSPSSSITPSL